MPKTDLESVLDLRVAVHKPYSKGFMKSVRFSPDAYIQMALQLAYYRVALPNRLLVADQRHRTRVVSRRLMNLL